MRTVRSSPGETESGKSGALADAADLLAGTHVASAPADGTAAPLASELVLLASKEA